MIEHSSSGCICFPGRDRNSARLDLVGSYHSTHAARLQAPISSSVRVVLPCDGWREDELEGIAVGGTLLIVSFVLYCMMLVSGKERSKMRTIVAEPGCSFAALRS